MYIYYKKMLKIIKYAAKLAVSEKPCLTAGTANAGQIRASMPFSAQNSKSFFYNAKCS
jgi:hypothetical protein